jgi:hypothetical protein
MAHGICENAGRFAIYHLPSHIQAAFFGRLLDKAGHMSETLLPQNRIPRSFARTISRRAVLRGAGVVMALPWLESARIIGAAPAFPKRFGVMFMGCGINEDYWSSTGDGAAMTLSKRLSQLEPL